jgi:pyruvate/2-oxoglutarate dehydrogenase complex dihydrolipoamide acyltransferase (E2) component
MNKQVWTEQDIDNLILSVEETLSKAQVLAKNTADGDPDPKDDQGPAPDQTAAPAEASAPAEEPAAPPADPAAPPAEGEQPPAEASAAPAEGEQALAEDGSQDQPLSDEELSQIYSSMPPEELERHYSIIRQALQASMGSEEGAAPADPSTAQPPAPAAPAPDAGMPPGMEKSESGMIAALQKQVAEQAAALEHVTKAFEVLAKPSRKSITDIQFMAKSDADQNQPGSVGSRPMSKDEVKAAVRKISPGALTKNERDMVNRFFIEGDGQAEIEKLIHSKGGK